MHVFDGIPCEFHSHDNTGWDIGAFQWAAREIECDMIVCFGAFSYFKRAGWLRRMRHVFREYGDGLYGASASYQFNPHIRTAGFWCHPELIRAYTTDVATFAERYAFEHGERSLTRLADYLQLGCWMVTWDAVYPEAEWRTPPNIFWRGDQSNSMFYDRQFETYDEHPLARPFYAAGADGWGECPGAVVLGKELSEWATRTDPDTNSPVPEDPWGFLARQTLATLKETAPGVSGKARIEHDFVAELCLDHLAWVRTELLDRLGLPEELLRSPDIMVAAIHSALRLNGYSGTPYNQRLQRGPWEMRDGVRLAWLRRTLLRLLQPFADNQYQQDARDAAPDALLSDEIVYLQDRVQRLEH